jgi:hypothetical protein
MNILDKARKLESTLAETLERAAERFAPAPGREPLEIVHAILERVDRRIEPAGRGRNVFPFNRIKVSIVADSREDRLRCSAVLDGEPTLRSRIVERLRARGCAVTDVAVRIAYVARSEAAWGDSAFHVEFDRAPASDPVRPDDAFAPGHVRLTVIHGTADKTAYFFSMPRINLGRCAEVRDTRSRLVRTNHVVFADTPTSPNQSVSRHHAHIEYAAGHYRIVDNRSAHGTSVVRKGRTIPVPAGSRGIRLESGDEIVLGEARVAVKV